MSKKVSIVIVTLLLASLGTAALAGRGVLLQHKLTPGAVTKYKMTMDMTTIMPTSGKGRPVTSTMRTSGVIRSKVLGLLPDGSAKVMVSTEQFKMEMPGAASSSTGVPAESFTMVIDRHGRILKQTSAGKSLLGTDAWSAGGFLQLPGRRVYVGDSWMSEVPIPGTKSALKIKNRLVSLSALIAGKRAAKITHTYSGKVNIGSPAPSNPKEEGTGAATTARFSGTGTTYFSISKGKVLQMTADTDVFVSTGESAPGTRMKMHVAMTAI